METTHLVLQCDKLLKQRNIAVVLGLAILVSNVLLSVAIISSDKEIVLVPNSIDRESSLTKGKMSQAYVEALSRDVVGLMLNVTPSNAEYSAKAILKITHPKFYGALKQALAQRSQDVINRRITNYFFPQSMMVGDDKTSVFVSGKFSSWVGKERVSEEEKTYSITYNYEGFQPLIVDFHEVDAKTGLAIEPLAKAKDGKGKTNPK